MRYLIIVTLTAASLANSASASAGWAGLYGKADGTVMGVAEFHEFGKAEILVNYTTGEAGALFELPDGRAGVGQSIGKGAPPPVHVLARSNGGIALDGEVLRATSIKRRPFTTRNGSVELAGELVRTTEKPHGVLLLIHGSGDGPRHAYDLWTNFFLSRGWAVIVYDKRGSGDSTGDWHETNFIALAEDARSVVRWARKQDDTRALTLGLWGVSQAGWIIPQLASEGLVDFAISQAGAVTPVDDFIRQTLESELRGYGFAPEEIAKAQDYYALDVSVSQGKQPFSVLQAAYENASQSGTEWLLKPPDPPGSPDRRFMATIAGFDAAPYWRRVRTPLLALFGSKDHVVPAEPNRRRLENLLADARNTRTQIVTLENDNHLNMLANTGVRTEYASLHQFDPVYFQALGSFLQQMSVPSH